MQKRFDIGGVRVGGIPGKDPTVLVGTLFYKRQRLISDEERGIFDKEKAEALIRRQEELSEKTGVPSMLDIEGATAEAMERFIRFTIEITDLPLMLGGPTVEVRRASLAVIKEAGIEDRVIYNSLMPGCTEAEVEMIGEAGVESAVLLAYNVSDLTSKGRIKTLRELMGSIEDHGITKPLLDTFVMDVPSLGVAFQAFREAKLELGLPVGCGPHNAIGMWKGLRKKMGLRSKRSVVAAVNSFATAAGADWILYGPIETARVAFPAVAMVDAAYAFPCIQQGLQVDREHPLFKIA
ncbi:MAG: tetrahydromethanopterin S-methyltransferase subunit H [Candidatus Bathyarchaeota archaeon]